MGVEEVVVVVEREVFLEGAVTSRLWEIKWLASGL